MQATPFLSLCFDSTQILTDALFSVCVLPSPPDRDYPQVLGPLTSFTPQVWELPFQL